MPWSSWPTQPASAGSRLPSSSAHCCRTPRHRPSWLPLPHPLHRLWLLNVSASLHHRRTGHRGCASSPGHSGATTCARIRFSCHPARAPSAGWRRFPFYEVGGKSNLFSVNFHKRGIAWVCLFLVKKVRQYGVGITINGCINRINLGLPVIYDGINCRR